MGIGGGLFRLGAQSAAQKSVDDRKNRINEMKSSGLIQFACSSDGASEGISKELKKYGYLNNMYLEEPSDEKNKEIIYEMASKLIKSQKECTIISGEITFFMMVNSILGKATNGMIACTKGIFSGGIPSSFTACDVIDSFEADKKGWVHINLKNGSTKYLEVLDTKDKRQNCNEIVQLLNYLYC